MTDTAKLADELASIASRCSHERDRETIIKAAAALRTPLPAGLDARTVEALRRLIALSPVGSFHVTPHWRERENLMAELRALCTVTSHNQPPTEKVEGSQS